MIIGQNPNPTQLYLQLHRAVICKISVCTYKSFKVDLFLRDFLFRGNRKYRTFGSLLGNYVTDNGCKNTLHFNKTDTFCTKSQGE